MIPLCSLPDIAVSRTESCPEVRLLKACARTVLSPEHSLSIRRTLSNEQVDWDLLWHLAQQHYVFPLVARSLRAVASSLVPPAVLREMDGALFANARKNLLHTRELVRIVNLLEQNSIPVIAFKGPVLAASVYGDLAARPFCDLDILVPGERSREARNLIGSLGYTEDDDPSTSRFEKPGEMHNEATGVRVEIHSTLIPRRLALSFESIWARAGVFVLAGAAIRILAVEDLLIYLCAHGGKHRWQRLQWICDIAELPNGRRDISWKVVTGRAHDLGARRLVCLGFAVAELVLGQPIPAPIRQDMDPSIHALAEKITSDLFSVEKRTLSEVESRLIELTSRERVRDRARILLRTAASRYGPRITHAPGRRLVSALKLIQKVLFS